MRPDIDSLKSVACMFSAYHGLKFGVQELFAQGGPLNPREPLPLTKQYDFFELFAKIYKIEAQEVGYPARAFSSADYEVFLSEFQMGAPALVQFGQEPHNVEMT